MDTETVQGGGMLTALWAGLGVAGRMMMMSPEDRRAFEALELRIRAILPEEYQDSYEEVEPVSMGSADLKYERHGKVAWNDIWDTFCDLAMAGGPPHKGTLLTAALPGEIDAEPERYRQVVAEICRGIEMVTGLEATLSPVPGWVRVECTSVTAGWLARAIVMENVSARCDGTMLDLPAGPRYRVEKEIKNVVTAMAKTGHYWLNHVGPSQQLKIGNLFDKITAESPLIQPPLSGVDRGHPLRDKLMAKIQQATGLKPWDVACYGWLGVICPSVGSAIWMMRAMVASNVFARREDTVLFVPVNPETDPAGDTVATVVARVHRFARARRIL